jgi:hypothetical protein
MSDKIYIPLEEGELVEREEALTRLNMPRTKLNDGDPEAELNFRIVIAMMVEFAMAEMGVEVTNELRPQIKYHLEEAAQEYLVG